MIYGRLLAMHCSKFKPYGVSWALALAWSACLAAARPYGSDVPLGTSFGIPARPRVWCPGAASCGMRGSFHCCRLGIPWLLFVSTAPSHTPPPKHSTSHQPLHLLFLRSFPLSFNQHSNLKGISVNTEFFLIQTRLPRQSPALLYIVCHSMKTSVAIRTTWKWKL